MEIKPIRTIKDYKAALKRLEKIFNAKPDTEEGTELELLSILTDNFENKKFPIDTPEPIEAIKFRMEQLGYSQKDLVKFIGSKSKVSEILNRKRKLSLPVIRNLSDNLYIPADILIKDYKVEYKANGKK
jgi:HTH-type transcriptional regulator/antitoxin HigA